MPTPETTKRLAALALGGLLVSGAILLAPNPWRGARAPIPQQPPSLGEPAPGLPPVAAADGEDSAARAPAELQDQRDWRATAADLRAVRNLLWKFRALDPAQRLDAVLAALTQLDPPARSVFLQDVARKLVEYDSALDDLAPTWTSLSLAERLEAMRALRRTLFGPETADALFEEEDKLAEYGVRVKTLLAERPGMDAGERKRETDRIAAQVFGDEADRYLPGNLRTPFERKLREIAPDLDRMDADERAAAVRRAREEAYGPEAAGRLDALDSERAERIERRRDFDEARAEIDGRADLSPEDKERMIEGLRRETFGEEEAEMMKRREEIHALTEAHAPTTPRGDAP